MDSIPHGLSLLYVIENRLDDGGCTLERVLQDNAHMAALALRHNVNYVLIDETYEIDIQ